MNNIVLTHKGGERVRTINNEVAMQYGLTINRLAYSRSNYYIDTTKGKFMLRKVLIPKEQIGFEYEVNQQLIAKGFDEIERLYPTQRNQPYMTYQDKMYVLQSSRQTTDTDFTNALDIKAIVGLLARFHQAGKGIQSEARVSHDAVFRNMYDYFIKRQRESRQIQKTINKITQKSPFERMFIDEYTVYEALEEKAISLISYDLCDGICKQAKQAQCVAHNEYTYHAVNKGENDYKIENLDRCTYNIQLMDLANVLVKIMQKNSWDIGLLSMLIKEYDKYQALSDNEMRVLKAMLIFPEKYATLCHKYMISKRRNHYSMFESKWENMNVYKEEQLKTIGDIEKNI